MHCLHYNTSSEAAVWLCVVTQQVTFSQHWIYHNIFLAYNLDTWDSDNDYIVAQQKVRSLKVVNETERGVAMIQSLNGVLTNQEEQK